MALRDFLKNLEEQNDAGVIYSKPAEVKTKVIPQSQSVKLNTETVKEKVEEKKKPTFFKLKIKEKKNVERPSVNTSTDNKPIEEEKPKQEPVKQDKVKEENTIDVEQLFIESETDTNKKSLWLEVYENAQNSKKQDYITKMIKEGKFYIDSQSQIGILSKYKTHNKTVNEILNDKWI